MTRDFSVEGFITNLISLSMQNSVLSDSALEWIGNKVEKAAKEKIGEYQETAGSFVAWAELADSTKQDRERQGYPDNEPLLRDGELRDSIEHTVLFQEVQIGSNRPIAEYQELGTEHIPPRSFLGGAAFEETPDIINKLGPVLESFLTGDGVFNGKLKIE